MRTRPADRVLAAGAGLMAGAGIAQLLPAALFLPPVRRWLCPRMSGRGRPDHVALTFDDGPHPLSTPHFLRVLERLGVTATFFVLADALARAPRLGQQLSEAGHEIGVHGLDHRCLARLSPSATYRALATATEVITEVTGTRPTWFRPAYGVMTGSALLAAHRLDLNPVWWTDWGFDWTARASATSVLATVERRLEGGATILLHDSDVAGAPGAWRATLAALPTLLEHLAQRGLRVGPLRDHGTRSECADDRAATPRRFGDWQPVRTLLHPASEDWYR